jgi:hypothetical protein
LGGRCGVVASFIRGRWTPDLTSDGASGQRNYTLGTLENGARFLGGGSLDVERVNAQGVAEPASVVYLCLDIEGEAWVVIPELLARLRYYALYRQRDQLLLGALRTRAIEWCKVHGLMAWQVDLAVTSAVMLAMRPSTHEELATPHVAESLKRTPPPHALA